MKPYKIIASLLILLLLSSCQPITKSNPPTGNILGPAIGGGAGAATAGIAGASNTAMVLSGITGAGIGYYFTTLRSAASGIIAAGGNIYPLGDAIVIYIPTDNLFDTNTSELLPGTDYILNSLVSVLNHYPCNNIFISGNTSGFGSERYEQKLSEQRAAKVAGFLWHKGINDAEFKISGTHVIKLRRLVYVGYDNYFPIANEIHQKGIRQNSRIQVVAFLSQELLHPKNFKLFNNIGKSHFDLKRRNIKDYNEAFDADHMPDNDLTAKSLQDEFKDGTPARGENRILLSPLPAKPHTYKYDVKGENNALTPYDPSKPRSAFQTESGVKDWKQGGFKGESLAS